MSELTERWGDVAAAVTQRMKDRGLRRQVDLVRATGLSDATVRPFTSGKLRAGAMPEPISRETVALALRWTEDSIDRILGGSPPLDLDVLRSDWIRELNALREPLLQGEAPPEGVYDKIEQVSANLRWVDRQITVSDRLLRVAQETKSQPPEGSAITQLRADLDRLAARVDALARVVEQELALELESLLDDEESPSTPDEHGPGAASPPAP